MKKHLVTVLLLIVSATTAFAFESDKQCLSAMKDVLRVTPGQQLELKGGVTPEGHSCEFILRYFEPRVPLTNEPFKAFSLKGSAQVAHMDGSLSPLMPMVLASLEDDSTGFASYDIKKCEVSSSKILVSYTLQQKHGWIRTANYTFNITVINGKVFRVQAISESDSLFTCTF